MKIGIFGGSFDPIHLGHTRIINEAIISLQLDKMLIVPTKHNPWKEDSVANNQQRIEMIQIALKDNSKCEVCTLEIDRQDNEKNYTIDTIKELKKIYKNDQLYFMMGMDQAGQFDKWKSAKEISELVQLVAFNRKGYQKNDVLNDYHFEFIQADSTAESSTQFKAGNKEIVDRNVYTYAFQNGLYLENFVSGYMSEKRFKHTCSVAKLAREFAVANGIDGKKAYIAGMLHDIAKEMDKKQEDDLMEKYFSKYVDKPRAIYHQWLSTYLAQKDFMIEDAEILQAIRHHTTASINMSLLDMCVYCADKLDPLRGYDSSKQIALCKEDIIEGFKGELKNFYKFSKKKNRPIDECFFDVYQVYCKGDLNG